MPNLGIHMSESDLTSPEPEFVINVYETFVDLLAGVSKEELNQPQFVGLGELHHLSQRARWFQHISKTNQKIAWSPL